MALRGVAVMVAVLSLAAEPPTWPQWRGPNRDGTVTGPTWPDNLHGLSQAWRVAELGPSYSGPIVAADRVFTTETRDKKAEYVSAYDRASGRKLWEVNWPGAMDVPFFARANGSWIRSTPAYDGERLYVGGIRDVLVCLDAKDGREVWRYDFMKEFNSPLPTFGNVCSPLVDATGVYVQAGGAVVKLDKLTGTLKWKAMQDGGGTNGSAFSSPVLTAVAGREQLLVQTREILAGLDPASGDVLWKQPVTAFRGMNIYTPVVFGDSLFTSTYGGKSERFDVSQDGGTFAVNKSWSFKAEGYMSTPVVIDGHAYVHLRNQRITCVDLKTGKQTWTSDRSYGKYWSLVANRDRVMALDEKGILYLIRANPEKFEILDSKKVSETESWAHLAVCGDEVFVRELNALTAYRWK